MHTRMKGLTLLMLFIGAYFSGVECVLEMQRQRVGAATNLDSDVHRCGQASPSDGCFDVELLLAEHVFI